MNPLVSLLWGLASTAGSVGASLAVEYFSEQGLTLPANPTQDDYVRLIGKDDNKALTVLSRMASDERMPTPYIEDAQTHVPDKMTLVRGMIQQILDARRRAQVADDVSEEELDLSGVESNLANVLNLRDTVPVLQNITGSRERFFALQWGLANITEHDWDTYETLFGKQGMRRYV